MNIIRQYSNDSFSITNSRAHTLFNNRSCNRAFRAERNLIRKLFLAGCANRPSRRG